MPAVLCEYEACRRGATIMVAGQNAANYLCYQCFPKALLAYQKAGVLDQLVILAAHSPAAQKCYSELNHQ